MNTYKGNKKETNFTDSPTGMMELVNNFRLEIPSIFNKKTQAKEHYFKIWAKADTAPLPGSFKTRSIYSKKFIPLRYLHESNSDN